MTTLLLISTPGKDLTYDDGDIVLSQEVNVSPGTEVEANAGENWSFVYITDKYSTDQEIVDLQVPLKSGVDPDIEYLEKRRYYCTLPGAASQYTTYRRFDVNTPSAMKMTWTEFSAILSDKQG